MNISKADHPWLFPVCVLETPLEVNGRYGPLVDAEREKLIAAYHDYKHKHPWMEFTKCSYEVRAQWLYEYFVEMQEAQC